MKKILNFWDWFWFSSKSNDQLLVLSCFRVLFYSIMLFCYISRIPDVDYFFTSTGILPDWHKDTIDYFSYHSTILSDSLPRIAIQGLHYLLLVSLLLCAIGFYFRFFSLIAYFLSVSFMHRNMGVIFGVDMISVFFLLYLCLCRADRYFCVDSIFRKKAFDQNWVSHIGWRLMQIQLCIVYAYSGLEKLKGTRWWNGSALWDVLTIGNMQRFDLSFVAHFPIVLSVLVYLVLAWEIYFPCLIWVKSFRLPMLLFGIVMHIGIYLFMNLPSFAFMMMSLYVLFLKPDEIKNLLQLRGLISKKLVSR